MQGNPQIPDNLEVAFAAWDEEIDKYQSLIQELKSMNFRTKEFLNESTRLETRNDTCRFTRQGNPND